MEFCVVPQAREFRLIKRTLSEYLPGVVGVRDVVDNANKFRRMRKGGRFPDDPVNFALMRYVLVHRARSQSAALRRSTLLRPVAPPKLNLDGVHG